MTTHRVGDLELKSQATQINVHIARMQPVTAKALEINIHVWPNVNAKRILRYFRFVCLSNAVSCYLRTKYLFLFTIDAHSI